MTVQRLLKFGYRTYSAIFPLAIGSVSEHLLRSPCSSSFLAPFPSAKTNREGSFVWGVGSALVLCALRPKRRPKP